MSRTVTSFLTSSTSGVVLEEMSRRSEADENEVRRGGLSLSSCCLCCKVCDIGVTSLSSSRPARSRLVSSATLN
ncbi:hypothetical protein BgiBS90_010905 [Biomphalaria glabrata]|nr:hypothetical protein BgiBS90_010905 [Biomphalaria glabrata]